MSTRTPCSFPESVFFQRETIPGTGRDGDICRIWASSNITDKSGCILVPLIFPENTFSLPFHSNIWTASLFSQEKLAANRTIKHQFLFGLNP